MAEILISEVTTGALNGDGIFDELMRGIQLRLDEEYSNNRLRGTDYSKVYLGSLQSSMQQAMAFALGRQQADAQAELTKAQLAKTTAEVVNLVKQGELIDQQILKMKSDITLTDQQILLAIQQEKNLVLTGTKVEEEVKALKQATLNAIQQGNILLLQQAKLEQEKQIVEKQLVEKMTDLRDKESDYFIKKDNSVYIVGNLTTSLKFFETQTKIMTEILKMNNNQKMKLNKFHSLLATYLKENLK